MSSFPEISASAEPSLFDEPIRITLKGLFPNQVVTVYASTSANKNCFYESFANYKASCYGTVDMSRDGALLGTYLGVEPMGLLWSMVPHAESKKKITRLVKTDVTKPQVYHLKVFDEEKHSLEECKNTAKSKIIASLVLNRWFMSPGVRRIPVRENGIVATLFLPPNEGPFPGVINLFGGHPGLLEYKSALHASHGFAALALAYFGIEHLPSSVQDQLDLEYFEKAVKYMKSHVDVQSDNGIGLFSICKGAIIALAMAAYLEDIRCIVSLNGSCCFGNEKLKYKDQVFNTEDFEYQLFSDSDNNLADLFHVPEAGSIETTSSFIPFHKKRNVSYMLVSGLNDACLPSRFLIGEMERLLHEENHPDFEILKYTDAGHLIEPPNQPFVSSFFQPGLQIDAVISNGGKLVSHCKCQQDSWPKMLQFLKERLVIKPGVVTSRL